MIALLKKKRKSTAGGCSRHEGPACATRLPYKTSRAPCSVAVLEMPCSRSPLLNTVSHNSRDPELAEYT